MLLAILGSFDFTEFEAERHAVLLESVCRFSGKFDYLEYLFTVMPTQDWHNNPEILETLTPCSPEIRKKFKN